PAGLVRIRNFPDGQVVVSLEKPLSTQAARKFLDTTLKQDPNWLSGAKQVGIETGWGDTFDRVSVEDFMSGHWKQTVKRSGRDTGNSRFVETGEGLIIEKPADTKTKKPVEKPKPKAKRAS